MVRFRDRRAGRASGTLRACVSPCALPAASRAPSVPSCWPPGSRSGRSSRHRQQPAPPSPTSPPRTAATTTGPRWSARSCRRRRTTRPSSRSSRSARATRAATSGWPRSATTSTRTRTSPRSSSTPSIMRASTSPPSRPSRSSSGSPTDYGTDATVTRLVDTREIFIVFALNPDGMRYDLTGDPFRAWRKNLQQTASGMPIFTDLNRNYGYRWACCGGSSSNRAVHHLPRAVGVVRPGGPSAARLRQQPRDRAGSSRSGPTSRSTPTASSSCGRTATRRPTSRAT